MMNQTPETSFIADIQIPHSDYLRALGSPQIHNSTPGEAVAYLDLDRLTGLAELNLNTQMTESNNRSAGRGMDQYEYPVKVSPNGDRDSQDSDRLDGIHFFHKQIAREIINEYLGLTGDFLIHSSGLAVVKSGHHVDTRERFRTPLLSRSDVGKKFLGLFMVFSIDRNGRYKPEVDREVPQIDGRYAMPTRTVTKTPSNEMLDAKPDFRHGLILSGSKSTLAAPFTSVNGMWSPEKDGAFVDSNGHMVKPKITPTESFVVLEQDFTTLARTPELNPTTNEIAVRFVMSYSEAA